MSVRNRSEGWRYAKLSGHANEYLAESVASVDGDLQRRLLACAKKTGAKVRSIDYGGLNEKKVPCILGGATKSKTDVYVHLDDGSSVNISIKKSLSGQVFLVSADRFVEGFERQFSKSVPSDVRRAVSLFWGTADDTEQIVREYGTTHREYELRKHRLVKQTLDRYDARLTKVLLDWFNDNLAEIFEFCFSVGLAADPSDWANVIWYKNELRENDADDLYFIEDVKAKLTRTAEYGTKVGGSTIQLPFGFVQWHSPTKTIPGSIQFHHSYQKIKKLMERDP